MSVRAMSAVWDCPDLDPNEKLVLLAYADHADHAGKRIFPSNATVSQKTGLSSRGVRKITSRLVDHGYLVVVEEGGGRGRPTLYELSIDEKRGTLCRVSESGSPEANRDKGSERASEKRGTRFRVSENPAPEDINPAPEDINPARGSENPAHGSPQPSVTISNHQEPLRAREPIDPGKKSTLERAREGIRILVEDLELPDQVEATRLREVEEAEDICELFDARDRALGEASESSLRRNQIRMVGGSP